MREFKQEIRKITKDYTREQNFKLAIYSAELVLPIFEKKYPKDNRPRKAIEAAKKCLESNSVENKELSYAAYAEAYEAVLAAYTAYYVAGAAVAASIAAAASYAAYAEAYEAVLAAYAYYVADAADAAVVYASPSDITQKIMDYAIKLAEEK